MEIGPPVPLVREIAQTLRPGRALDLACGSGRNAFWLAQNGWDVTAVDRAAGIEDHGVHSIVADLELGEYKVEEGVWDLIVISYYLQRDLFAPAIAGLRSGGVIVAIVLMSQDGDESRPFRLKPNELIRYFNGCEILHQYEGPPRDGSHHRSIAEVAARKQPAVTPISG